MANARGKEIDTTDLDIDAGEERIIQHRDLSAHVWRWTHVAKRLGTGGRYKTSNVLDIGCGCDLPLARMLYSNRFIPNDYCGVDYNPSKKFKTAMFEKGRFPLYAYGSIDFASDKVLIRPPEMGEVIDSLCLYVDGDNFEAEHILPNVLVSFENLEHVEAGHTRRMLEKMLNVMKATKQVRGEEPVAFISTPCYDAKVGAAANHSSEATRDALGAVMEDLGFGILENYGTFASIKDYRDNLLKERPELTRLYHELHAYYDVNALANFFAPIVPQWSRNNLWVVGIQKEGYTRKFPPLKDVPGPWTSSVRWQELAGE